MTNISRKVSPREVIDLGKQAKSAYYKAEYPQPFTSWFTGRPMRTILAVTAAIVILNVVALRLRDRMVSEALIVAFLLSIVTLGCCWLASAFEMAWQAYRAIDSADARLLEFDRIDWKTLIALKRTDPDDRRLLLFKTRRVRRTVTAIVGAVNFAVTAYVFHGIVGLSSAQAVDFILRHQTAALFVGIWFGLGYAILLMLGKFTQDDLDVLELSLDGEGGEGGEPARDGDWVAGPLPTDGARLDGGVAHASREMNRVER
jgi:hypothetical protein